MFIKEHEEKRVDPRIKRTRKLLNQAFLELLNEKGFQSITIQDITDRAEVNRATFYAHYEDKYDLLDSYMREGFLDWLSHKNPSMGKFQVSQLTRLVQSIFEFSEEMDAHCGKRDKQLEPMLAAAIQEELARYLLAWFKKTPVEQSFLSQPPETIARIWSWAILGASTDWSRGQRSLTMAEVAAQVVEVLTNPFSVNAEKI